MSTRRTQNPVSLVVAPDPRDASDAELARALIAGKGWAITETWHRFAAGVILLARRALGSQSAGGGIPQGGFALFCGKANTRGRPERLQSFISSFAIRILRTELRRRKTRAWLSFH